MEILLNGERHEVAASLSLAQLLEMLGVRGRFAVEVNGDIMPRSRFAEYHLRADDAVEIVKAIGGG